MNVTKDNKSKHCESLGGHIFMWVDGKKPNYKCLECGMTEKQYKHYNLGIKTSEK